MSTKTTNKKLAEDICKKASYEMIEGRWFKDEKARKKSFQNLVDKYMETYSRQRDKYTKNHLLKYFGDFKLSEIDPIDVQDYITDRLESSSNPSHSTIYLEYAFARRLFNIARKVYKWATENPFADFDYKELLDRDNPRTRVMSVAEELHLLNNAYNSDIRDFIIACIHSGCRMGEVLDWNWYSNVDLFKRVLIVKVSKRTRKKILHKYIPMSDTLFEVLSRRAKVKNITGKVFAMNKHAARYAFDMTVKAAKIQNVHLHDCRRTFSTRLDESGVPLHTIKTLLGHETGDVTETHYIHRTVESLRPYILLLDNYYKEKELNQDELISIAG